ncbi:hypothetical protein NDU88_001306 [Pleurodeles waltl]|uniref:Uncharacterized protein n=1 Tax=Pleurodeles waltl TaxID=8319 RepID=A0AAV7THH1_PLEWA|nr:hypothetical protein NDU88_001306 [Pleurodeles waltl]
MYTSRAPSHLNPVLRLSLLHVPGKDQMRPGDALLASSELEASPQSAEEDSGIPASTALAAATADSTKDRSTGLHTPETQQLAADNCVVS